MDIVEIQKYQQNRHPLLFIDKITELSPGSYAKGFKNFTYNEWFFPAHFSDDPNVPGFIQIECLVQVFIMCFLSLPGLKGKKTNFARIEEAQFKKKIVPGDKLDIEASLESFSRGLAKGTAIGKVAGEIAVSARFLITVPDELIQIKLSN